MATRVYTSTSTHDRSLCAGTNQHKEQLSSAIMAQKADLVASAPNRITDRVFVDALSSSDRVAMSEQVADFFCEDESLDDGNESEEEAELGR